MPTITFVTNGGKTAQVEPQSNLLRASLRWQGGIPFKCGAGLCGTCKCHIDSGLEHTDAIKAKERRHLTDEDFRNGYRMACQTFVHGDVSVSWLPRPVPAPPAAADPMAGEAADPAPAAAPPPPDAAA